MDNHLLVGGDNMDLDLALAYSVARQLSEEGERLDAWQIRGLWHSCRQAKERLLADPDLDEHPETILGGGSRLIGGTLKATLSRQMVDSVMVDGFFPRCEVSAAPKQDNRVGIQEIGLAYESDPAVPGLPAPTKALCIAPFGMEECSQARLEDREFALVVGDAAKFDFLGSMRHDDAFGDVIEDWQGEVEAIAEIETTLDGETGSVIPVTLEVAVTEVGTLALWCVSKADGRRWKLEFNVREQEAGGT